MEELQLQKSLFLEKVSEKVSFTLCIEALGQLSSNSLTVWLIPSCLTSMCHSNTFWGINLQFKNLNLLDLMCQMAEKKMDCKWCCGLMRSASFRRLESAQLLLDSVPRGFLILSTQHVTVSRGPSSYPSHDQLRQGSKLTGTSVTDSSAVSEVILPFPLNSIIKET